MKIEFIHIYIYKGFSAVEKWLNLFNCFRNRFDKRSTVTNASHASVSNYVESESLNKELVHLHGIVF